MRGASNFLIGAGNNKICAVHGDKICRVLAIEMILGFVLPPVQG
jgi:hypothetical protein